MRFNFDRSFVLGSLRADEADANIILITRAFHGGIARIPRRGVTCQVVKELKDSSVRVVDFDEGTMPTEAIIGIGDESKLFTL